jgi:hypothetical protein
VGACSFRERERVDERTSDLWILFCNRETALRTATHFASSVAIQACSMAHRNAQLLMLQVTYFLH